VMTDTMTKTERALAKLERHKVKQRRGRHKAHVERVERRESETQRVLRMKRITYEPKTIPGVYKPGCTITLWPIQWRALNAIRHIKGGLFPIACGEGKTLISLLAGTVVPSVEKVLVLCPATVVSQTRAEYERRKTDFEFRNITVTSYASLSSPGTGPTFLPDWGGGMVSDKLMIVMDEAHRIKSGTTRTRRLLDFMDKYPNIKVVALSGTMTTKSINDFARLALITVGQYAPVPLDHNLRTWCEAMDSGAMPSTTHTTAMRSLIDNFHPERPVPEYIYTGRVPSKWNAQHGATVRRKFIRDAFHERLRTAPGVVCTTDEQPGASLTFESRTLKTPWHVGQAFLKMAQEGEDPDDNVVVEDSTQAMLKRQFLAGFFYRWLWPDGEPDWDWLDARKSWQAAVRRDMERRAAPGYDSEKLIRGTIADQLNTVSPSRWRAIHRAYDQWRGFMHQPEPPREAVWLDDYMVQDVLRLAAREGGPAIIWYHHKAVGDKLREAGVTVYGEGDGIDQIGTKAHLCAMSIRAQGTGLNLQPWNLNIVMHPPSSGAVWEQMIARTHRSGQENDVRFIVYVHDLFGLSIASALEDAQYIADTSGQPQRLMYGAWL